MNTLILNKIDFKFKKCTREQEHYIVMNDSIYNKKI